MKRSIARNHAQPVNRLAALGIMAAVAAGSAFAQDNGPSLKVSGAVQAGIQVIGETDPDGDDLMHSQLTYGLGRIRLDGQNGDGIFGGTARLDLQPRIPGGTAEVKSSGGTLFAWAWWQPIDMIKVVAGFQDGVFGANNLMGWGFHANDADDILGVYHTGYGAYADLGNYNGAKTTNGIGRNAGVSTGFTDQWGLSLAIKPIEALTVGVGVPFDIGNGLLSGEGNYAHDVYSHTQAHIRYQLDDAGSRIALSFTGSSDDYYGISKDNSAIYLGFYFLGVENLKLNFGVKYVLPTDHYTTVLVYEDDGTGASVWTGKTDEEKDYTVHTPVQIGLGAFYTLSDAIEIRARFGFHILGSIEYVQYTAAKGFDDGTGVFGIGEKAGYEAEWSDPFKISFDLLPVIDIGIVKLYANMGLEYISETETKPKSGSSVKGKNEYFGWGFNPYITKSVGNGTFYAGFHLQGDKFGDGDMMFSWKVPVGMSYSF